MKTKTLLVLLLIAVVGLFDYKFAKFIQTLIIERFQGFSYILSISIPWLVIGLAPFFIFQTSVGLAFDIKKILINKSKLVIYAATVLLGLALFLVVGIDKYFASVKYPIILFLITPIVEESIFRGWAFGFLEKINKKYVIILTAILFALHHLQYFNFSLTRFAIFQVAYTLILGLLLGKIRKLSGGIYIGLLLHILINFAVVYF